MTITVEDGSLVTGANSYITEAQLGAHACAREITLTVKPETLIKKAMDFFESYDGRFMGQRVERDQALSFPRTDLFIEGWSWSHDEMPRQVINAILTLCMEINAGNDPFNPPDADLPVIKKRVEGVVDIQYANPGQSLKVDKNQQSRTHIRLLLRNSGLQSVRV